MGEFALQINPACSGGCSEYVGSNAQTVLARVFLARAEDDKTLIRKVISDADIADAIVGFHAQQAAEKSLKAVLAARGVSFAKSHALGYLIGLI